MLEKMQICDNEMLMETEMNFYHLRFSNRWICLIAIISWWIATH